MSEAGYRREQPKANPLSMEVHSQASVLQEQLRAVTAMAASAATTALVPNDKVGWGAAAPVQQQQGYRGAHRDMDLTSAATTPRSVASASPSSILSSFAKAASAAAAANTASTPTFAQLQQQQQQQMMQQLQPHPMQQQQQQSMQQSYAQPRQQPRQQQPPQQQHGIQEYFPIPNKHVGLVIGKAGSTIQKLESETGAKIQCARDSDYSGHGPRQVSIQGSSQQVAHARKLISELLSTTDTRGHVGGGSDGGYQPQQLMEYTPAGPSPPGAAPASQGAANMGAGSTAELKVQERNLMEQIMASFSPEQISQLPPEQQQQVLGIQQQYQMLQLLQGAKQ